MKVIKIDSEKIEFEDGFKLYSEHEQSCCENHFLSFDDLTISDFEGLDFNITNDNFFERIPGYGIAIKPINGLPIRVPGYSSNNGYYSDDLSLIVKSPWYEKVYDITECQSE